MDKENMLRAMVATKQLEIDKLKRIVKEKDDTINANSNRQRSNPTRKKAKGITKSSDSN
jgi:hypothetical protein|tara:strand:+ start:101 stop:277 length:177 start_codon:yes stop_codon:yes gene_type:complete